MGNLQSETKAESYQQMLMLGLVSRGEAALRTL
jgi:hypothetical protein